MNNNVSECKIEIDGTEYTLFLNRAGIVNWEKITKAQEKAERFSKMQKSLEETAEVEITDDTDPFSLYGEDSDLESNLDEMIDVYAKFYWIALFTHHKLSVTKAKELFDKAIEEYGLDQLAELANQMVTDANSNIYGKRKNLSALKSTKKN